MWKFITSKWSKLNCASGVVSEGQGMTGAGLESGFGAILLGSLIGAFFGLIVGFIVSHLLRFLSMTFNRNLGGFSWVIVFSILGAIVFAMMAANGEKH
jgi:hypothetical protein